VSLPTAVLVDNSTTSCSHAATGWESTVLVVVDAEEFGGKVSSVPPAGPEDAVPPPPALPLPVVPPCARGATAGWAHIAPSGHVVDPGGLVTGAQGADCAQLPVTSSSVKYERMATPDEVVRVNRSVNGVGPAVDGRLGPPALGAKDAPARPGTVVVDGAAASGVGVELPPSNWAPAKTPEPTRVATRSTAPNINVPRLPDRLAESSMSARGLGLAWTSAAFWAKWERRLSSKASLMVRSPFSVLSAPGE
jgi:hypothetical protein